MSRQVVIILLLTIVASASAQTATEYEYPLRTLGIISAGTAAACLTTGIIFNYLAGQAYTDSENLYTEYSIATEDFDAKWTEYEDTYSSSKSRALVRNVLYIGSGAFAAFGTVAIFFIKQPVEKKVSLHVAPDRIALTYRF